MAIKKTLKNFILIGSIVVVLFSILSPIVYRALPTYLIYGNGHFYIYVLVVSLILGYSYFKLNGKKMEALFIYFLWTIISVLKGYYFFIQEKNSLGSYAPFTPMSHRATTYDTYFEWKAFGPTKWDDDLNGALYKLIILGSVIVLIELIRYKKPSTRPK